MQWPSGRGRVKTSARFHTSLFRSLLWGLRAFRVEKIEKNLALLDRLQNFAEFLHGLGRDYALRERRLAAPCDAFREANAVVSSSTCSDGVKAFRRSATSRRRCTATRQYATPGPAPSRTILRRSSECAEGASCSRRAGAFARRSKASRGRTGTPATRISAMSRRRTGVAGLNLRTVASCRLHRSQTTRSCRTACARPYGSPR